MVNNKWDTSNRFATPSKNGDNLCFLCRVGLGSTKLVGYGSDWHTRGVQQVRAGERAWPDLAVLVLRNAVNPRLPNIRPAMIFRQNEGSMGPGDGFTAVGWGRNKVGRDPDRCNTVLILACALLFILV